MSANDVNFFFTMRDQIKLFHWQTTSFAMHKATDAVISALDESIDKYVEVYMGTYGRPRLSARSNTIRIQNLNEKSIAKFIKACITHLQINVGQSLRPTDTDLVNIRDEMLAELNQLMYLFTLH